MSYDASFHASEYTKLLWPDVNGATVRQGCRELWKVHSLVAAGACVNKGRDRARYSDLLLKSFASTHTRKANEQNGFESLAILGTGFYNSAVHRSSCAESSWSNEDAADQGMRPEEDPMFFGLGPSLKAPVAASPLTNVCFSSQLLAMRTLSTLVSSPLTLRLSFPYIGPTLRRTAMLFATGRLCVFNEWRVLQGHPKVSTCSNVR